MYKEKYNKYEDLQITDFEDQIELLFTVKDQLEDSDICVDIVADSMTIRYLLSLAMTELDFAPRKISMEKDDALYCLEMFDDGSLRVFLCDQFHNDSLQGTSIYLYQNDVTQDVVEFMLNFYDDSNIILYGYDDEDDDFATGDVSDLDVNQVKTDSVIDALVGLGVLIELLDL